MGVAISGTRRFGETGLGDHAAVADQHDVFEAKALLQSVAGSIGKRNILRALPDPSFGRRLHGFADGAITGRDEKQRHAIRRALGVDDVMQAHLTAVMDQPLKLEHAVELRFIEMLQACDHSGARHAQHQKTASCIGKRLQALATSEANSNR